MKPEDIKIVIKKKVLRNGKVFIKEVTLQELIEYHPTLLWEGDTYKILEPPKVVFNTKEIFKNRPVKINEANAANEIH